METQKTATDHIGQQPFLSVSFTIDYLTTIFFV